MSIISVSRKFGLSLTAIGLAYAGTVSANALTATQIVEKEVVSQNADGSIQTIRMAADKVIPGERIVYTLRYFNEGTEPVSDLVLTMPVPKEITFIDGSADKVGTDIVYSADGGDSFAERDALRIVGTEGASRPALATDITHIRWTIAGPVQTQETGELLFKGVLK